MNWTTPPKPAEFAETQLIQAILDGTFPIDTHLPAERELAAQLGITRPTLREALQRLARDGWLEIHHGRPTRVRNYWQEGNLAVLGALVRHNHTLPPDFISNLLGVRLLLAPAYTRLAVANDATTVAAVLHGHAQLGDDPQAFAEFDWNLHHQLTVASSNPIFTLILNGFCDFYQNMAEIYFQSPHSRINSRAFYGDLLAAARAGDAQAAEAITRQVMHDSVDLWQAALFNR